MNGQNPASAKPARVDYSIIDTDENLANALGVPYESLKNKTLVVTMVDAGKTVLVNRKAAEPKAAEPEAEAAEPEAEAAEPEAVEPEAAEPEAAEPKAKSGNIPAKEKAVGPMQKACARCRAVKMKTDFGIIPAGIRGKREGDLYATCIACADKMAAKKAAAATAAATAAN